LVIYLTHIFHTYRLREHISQCENGKLYLSDIEKKLKGTYTKQEIGRAVKRVFKGTIIKTARNKEVWSKLSKVYLGLEWKQFNEFSTLVGETSSTSNASQINHSEILSEKQSKNNDNTGCDPKHDSVNLDHSYTEIDLQESDHEDMKIVLNSVTTDESLTNIFGKLNLSEKQILLIKSQVKNIQGNPHSRRWNTEVIRLCLSLYCRSPKNYEYIANSGFLILPSSSNVKRYKNKVDQKSGINKDVFKWMKEEAVLLNLPSEGYEGGLLIDEMSIQPDLQLKRIGQEYQLIGFTDCCEESKSMALLSGKNDLQLATHVLQFLFIGHTGFRFPVAHFPTVQATPSELYLSFWRLVQMLSLYDFTVTYVSIDGAQSNRSFMKMFLPENHNTSDTMNTVSFINIFDNSLPKINIIMDYSHVMKKIRNNILKSGHLQYCKRLLMYNNQSIIWDHWLKSYQWDVSSNCLKIYPQLTEEHFHLNSQLKMRNKLAENVLDKNMLNLMELYKKSLGENGNVLNSSIELLKNTSVLVEIFRDNRPLKMYEDSRIAALKKYYCGFKTGKSQYSLQILKIKRKV
jgi:hypothetical protein